MSEDDAASYEGDYEGGRPLGLYLLVGVIVALVAVSGMFAIGYIPPVAKLGHHPTATSNSTQTTQFITTTVTLPPATSTINVAGKNTTITTSSVVTTTVSSTSTQTTTQTVTTTSVSTSTTAATTIYTPTTTTSTTITTTTTTVAPTGPLTLDVAMTPSGVPATLHPGEAFVLDVTIQSKLNPTFATLSASQETPGNTPQVTSFYPTVPESLTPVQGTSYYTLTGTINTGAPVGSYVIDVQLSGSSPVNNTQMSVSKQFIINIVEPLSFTGFKFVNSTSQFNGTCTSLPLSGITVPTWGYQCKINAAPMVNGTIDFTVSNAANVPICIQTSFGSSSMNGFVHMNPYPFCPNGASGVLVPAGAVNYAFVYLIENGSTAGTQSGFFTFERLST